MNSKKDELISFLNSKIDDKLEKEDYGNCEYYSFDYNWLSLRFEFDVLVNIGFGHFWDDNDKPIWKIT